jgi:hypothetical protein
MRRDNSSGCGGGIGLGSIIALLLSWSIRSYSMTENKYKPTSGAKIQAAIASAIRARDFGEIPIYRVLRHYNAKGKWVKTERIA